ncbi:hypothetical protein PPYC1_06460 [Paenibacillus polymyxa]|uniref:hypothetical protein n=1 Tax=Paenibacillus polymyxa TaxID=1406 RepID=UPI0008FC96A5|nr:hypothetical protein [Paenibacillus polymyxa]APB70020.1 hypothetical protein PPYC1_06460 [Paenibacillus polymyxa]
MSFMPQEVLPNIDHRVEAKFIGMDDKYATFVTMRSVMFEEGSLIGRDMRFHMLERLKQFLMLQQNDRQ